MYQQIIVYRGDLDLQTINTGKKRLNSYVTSVYKTLIVLVTDSS